METAPTCLELSVLRCNVSKSYAVAVADDQKDFLSDNWHDSLSRLIAKGKKASALAFLEKTIEHSLPLFRTDRVVFEYRRTAWLIRTHLLLEWNRPAEALAWTCLECQLSSDSRDAKALRDRLLRQLSLDFEPLEASPDMIATETQRTSGDNPTVWHSSDRRRNGLAASLAPNGEVAEPGLGQIPHRNSIGENKAKICTGLLRDSQNPIQKVHY